MKHFDSKFDLINKISTSISVKELIVQIKEILYKIQIGFKYDSFIENDKFWASFIQNIFHELANRPILLEKNKNVKAKKIENFNIDFSIYGIQLVGIKDKICIEILSNELETKNKNLYIDFIITK